MPPGKRTRSGFASGPDVLIAAALCMLNTRMSPAKTRAARRPLKSSR
jgi:hypothetical protein